MTATIVQWPRHLRYNCGQDCERNRDRCVEGLCVYCAGGLYLCRVCGGAEGDLPTDCPGYRMHEAERAAVYNRHVDYVVRRGGWVALSDEGQFVF